MHMDPSFRQQLIEDFHREVEVPRGTCMLSFRGSIAHNMFTGDSSPSAFDDVDLLGVVIGEPKHYFGLQEWSHRGTKEIKQGRWDIVYYDLRKMVGLLLKGNPNVMSTLWLRDEDYLVKDEVWQLLIDYRHLFDSKHVCNAFGAYAGNQLLKMTSRDPAELRDYMALTYEAKARGIHPSAKGTVQPYPENHDAASGAARNAKAHANDVLLAKLAHYSKKGENPGYLGDKRKQSILEHGIDRKNAAHCVRLLRMAIEYKRTGTLMVYRPDAAELLEIKTGHGGGRVWTLERIQLHTKDLMAELESVPTNLPDEPDYDGAEKLLVGILGVTLYGRSNAI